MSHAGDAELPAEALEKTKQHTLDTIAAMVSGVNLPPAQVALKFARAHVGEKTIPVVGTDILCGPLGAAIANGMLAHSDETDDSHAPSHSHPGCSVVSAALVAGQYFGIDGTRLLRAIALGYDIGTRVTLCLGGLPFQMQTHRSAHSIASTFGASAAAACAGKFSAQQMRWVLDYSAQQASGIAAWQRDTQHIEKSLVFAGFPARNALSTALLIQVGATGVDDIFAGADNFLIALSPTADPSKLTDKLGERFEVVRTTFKKWTVGSPIQAPLDAVQSLMEKNHLNADDIQSVDVHVATSEAKTVNNREMPDISLQHMIAVMMLDKTVSFQAAHDEARMKDPAVLKQKAKVHLIPDAELERLYPKRVTVVQMTLNDGRKLSQRVEAVRGTPDNPMSRDEVIAKARDLMEPYLGKEQTNRLVNTVFELEKVEDVRSLRSLLQRTG
jgi:2-methylcitrate dehydratase PrpD